MMPPLSKRRQAILDALCATRLHPTALELHDGVRQLMSGTTLATVYRNLHALVAAGLVKQVNVGDGVAHYDADTHEHCHVHCLSCGRVDDLPFDPPRQLTERARRESQYEVQCCHVSFDGTCAECRPQG